MACGSIWPKIIKYDASLIAPNSGLTHTVGQNLLVGMVPWTTPIRIELPIFRPNQYFWDKHVEEGEERWFTYRRVMRDIMSKHSGLPLSPMQIEDKFEYQKILKSLIKKDKEID